MSVSDLRITEVMYNPAPGAFEYIEVTNTGATPILSTEFFVGNSDFLPEYYSPGPIGPTEIIPGGATMILVPIPNFGADAPIPTQADFEAVYGPVPAGAVLIFYAPFPFGASDILPGNLTYTLGGNDPFIDSVFIPGGAAPGQSVSVSLADGSTTIGAPTPGSVGEAPPPPPTVGEDITGTSSSDVLGGTAGDDTIDGGSGNDDITGGDGNDGILGGKGKDSIDGGNGNDVINGGGQNDAIDGGAGDDDISGENGNDVINGGDGNDEIFGGSGGDIIDGGADDDVIYGDHGTDDISGGTGSDILFGGASNDVINGDDGNDLIGGDNGNDTLFGGAGDDAIDGGSQADALFGGDGNDQLSGGLGDDEMTGGAGSDVFIFSGVTNNDVITDFEAGVDLIDITSYGLIPGIEAVLSINAADGATILDFGQFGEVTLLGVNAAELTASDFLYFPDDIFTVG